MAWTKLSRFLGKTVVILWPGVLASILAVSITWRMNQDDVKANHINECRSRPCYVAMEAKIDELDSRLTTMIELSTLDRYKSSQAKADHKIMMEYINRNNDLLRKDLKSLQEDLNDHVKEYHMRVR